MAVFGDEFFETPAGQTIAGAHRYLSAARLLRFSEDWGQKLQTPVLHLLAHGVELLLKYPLLASGASPRDVAIKYGHDLVKLWNDRENRFLRPLILDRSEKAWEESRVSGAWPCDNFALDPRQELKFALDKLSYLHSRDSGYALRYIITPNTSAPRPGFLIDVFDEVAERGAKNPTLLTQSW
jgi:hypothetical protein